MDDLDHSMHIAEYDWTSFYEDSEECGLLQPSLAYLDNLSLSDSEDSGNSGSVFSTGQQKLQPSSAANSDEAESNTAGCCLEEGQINESGSAGDQDLATMDEADSERWIKSDIDYPEGHRFNTEEVHMRTAEDVTSTLQNEQPNVQCSGGESTELKKEAGDVEGDTSSIRELDPFSRNRAELNVNEPQAADGAVNEGMSSVRVETERWFVTVNDSPARLRARATSVKKKRRQKKACKNHMCPTTGRDKSGENGLELMKDNQSERGRETQSNQNLGGYPSSEENPESMQMGVLSDSFQMSLTSGEEDSLSDKVVTSHSTELTDRNKHDPSSSGSTLPDTFTSKDPSRLDSVESDELGDSLEFLSTHSYDSESYLSATESVEEPRHLLVEQLQSSSSPTNNNYLFNMTVNADTDNTQEREMHLGCSVTATNCEGYESTEPTLTFPSAAQSANKMPDDASTCDNDTRRTLPSDSPGLQKQEINLSASAFSSGDRLSLPPVPDVAPCPAADSPETYVKAAGHTRPVYAISAFWDEMEKLTINDILQLRMCRSPPPGDTRETPNVEDFPTNHSSLVDTVDYNLPDAALMDMSDTADSDYFTQPDESKPDRSSCEFSTSDFEEEYWQFLGASRNPSPDPQSKSQQRSCDSPFFAHEEEESTSSEGKETPVPSEDFAGECFEDEDSNSFTSSELSWPRPIAKSKSVHNVQALNTEDLSLQLLIGSDECNLFRSSSPSLEENVLLKAGDSLATPFLSNTDALDDHTPIYFPEVFDYFLTEDKANRDSQTVTVYDPEDISVAPVFDYALCSFRDETLFSSLCDSQRFEERPIPIFSCSRPTIRELTFPNPDYFFFSADCKDEDDISPIRVVSRYFIQGSDLSAGSKCSWRSFLSIRKIRFHDKGNIWCRRSGAWVFPVEAEKITIKKADPPKAVLTEWRVSSTPSRSLSSILETVQATRREGMFSTLKQSDMCLVCIAFASWVLTSSDPEAADAWKAALLANVSALSAIQYLRQYVKKKNPSQDDP